MRGRGRNAQVVCAGRCVSRVFSHHTRNVVHGYSLCLVLLLLLQPAARRPLQPPSYCLAASLLFTSPFDGNSPKSRGIFPSVGLGWLFPECLSTLLREVQAARRCTGRLLQAHSPPTVSVSGLGRPRVADRLATIHSACQPTSICFGSITYWLEAKSVESRNAMERSTASKYSELPCFCQVNRADAWCGDCSVGYGGIEHDCSCSTCSLLLDRSGQ